MEKINIKINFPPRERRVVADKFSPNWLLPNSGFVEVLWNFHFHQLFLSTESLNWYTGNKRMKKWSLCRMFLNDLISITSLNSGLRSGLPAK